LRLQLLLHPDRRTPEAVAAVKQILGSLGIVPTAAGAATISAEVDANTFQTLFGESPDESRFADPAKSKALPIPEPLKNYVQSITVAPRHIYMNKPKP
jgi:hypothetical protein